MSLYTLYQKGQGVWFAQLHTHVHILCGILNLEFFLCVLGQWKLILTKSLCELKIFRNSVSQTQKVDFVLQHESCAPLSPFLTLDCPLGV